MAEAQNQQIDSLLENVQNRRDQARKSETPDITTDRRPTREDENIPRSPTTRLIRGSLAATLKDIKNDPQTRIDLLPGFVRESRKLAEDLDKLDVQFHKNGRIIDAEVPNRVGDMNLPGERTQPIYAVDLDLNPVKEGEEDTRIPWVMIGGTTSISEQNAALSMALALQGEKITVLTYPEQMREQAGGRSFLDKTSNIGDENINAFKDVVRKLGNKQVNLIGHSFGGTAVLNIADDSIFAKDMGIHNVVALAPAGFERRNVVIPINNIGTKFNEQAAITKADPEANVMMLEQGNTDAKRPSGIQIQEGIIGLAKAGLDFLSGGRAAATKRIDAATISRAAHDISGNLEVWVGDKDTVCRSEPVQKVMHTAVEFNPDIKGKIVSYTVEGAVHDTFITNALGLVSVMKQEGEVRQGLHAKSQVGQKMSVDSLKRAGSEVLLEKMKQKTA